ncbi:MAG: hypothetical protein K5986_00215 [Clostridium sp.]|nr:hypothetical protein [Clostridium sp.]
MREKLKKAGLFLIPLIILVLTVYCTQKGNKIDVFQYMLVSAMYSIIYFLLQKRVKYLDLIHKYRYVIATILFIFLVAFKFHGSSIAMWDKYYRDYGDSEVKTMYTGEARAIRSDEWLVQTPLYLSQLTKEDKLSRINENIRSDGQDMVLASYSPVKDITILGKPFSWGFLFLGKERAFSWYWNFKLISLFMLSYEMALILIKRNKKISLFGACLIAYAPACQWWFSTFVLDLIIFAQAMMVAVYNYLKYNKYKYKLLNLLMFTIAGTGFVLSLYPATQVPLGYLIAIFCIFLLVQNREKIKLKDIILIGVSFTVILSIGGYFLYTVKDSIVMMMSTVYPGQRTEVGGNFDFKLLSSYIFNWLMPYREVGFSNSSELSSFISLLPLTLIMFFFRDKKKDNNLLKICMFVYILILLSYMIIGYPVILAKITLFSFIPAGRAAIILGLTSFYLFLMLVTDLVESKKINNLTAVIITVAVILFMFIPQYHTDVQYYMCKSGIITAGLIFTAITYFSLKGYVNQLVSFGIIFVLIGGFSINPIARTLAPIYDKEVSKAIVSINEEDKGKWVCLDNIVGGNLLYALGVQSFNGVQYYPDLNMWNKLDENEQYEDVYNRYAHVVVKITNEDTSFKLNQADVVEVDLSTKDIGKAGIKYLISQNNLQIFNSEKTIFKELYHNTIDNVYIYEYVG